ncbi:hypothetical protein SAMN02745127_01178 [Oceanospirillum multiglobuliferum]|uniref:Uncharacterized protein n=1 Tax=Oceanospirillum multiglobuliferum TaxID=64969 RepID=A0A1T4NNJ9_9GAMM|nr:hypothetical protein BTE48_07570 [Oceanospirillum multiglobuliferum]SJZ80685.1 hypothetical protein SAMN02745127_01178 [Oceanospirillum multiglobuliferum]
MCFAAILTNLNHNPNKDNLLEAAVAGIGYKDIAQRSLYRCGNLFNIQPLRNPRLSRMKR